MVSGRLHRCTYNFGGGEINVAGIQGDVVSPPPAEAHFACDGLYPSWAADGRQLAAATSDGELFTFDRTCRRISTLQITARMATGLCGLRTMKLRVHCLSGSSSGTGLDWDVWVVDSEWNSVTVAPPQEQLTFTGPAFWELDPTWSPDGSRVAYRGCRTTPGEPGCNKGTLRIESIGSEASGKTNSSTARTLTDPGDSFLSTPAYSPDGTTIAFTDTTKGIMLMNADGTGLTHLAGSQPGDSYPQWRPNLKRPEDLDVYAANVLGPDSVFEYGEPVRAYVKTFRNSPAGAHQSVCAVPDGPIIQPACQPQEGSGVWVSEPGARPRATVDGARIGSNEVGSLPAGRYRLVVEEVPFRSPGLVDTPFVVKCAGKCGRPAALPKVSAHATADGLNNCLMQKAGYWAFDIGVDLLLYSLLGLEMLGFGVSLPIVIGVVGLLAGFEILSGVPVLTGVGDLVKFALQSAGGAYLENLKDKCEKQLAGYEKIADDRRSKFYSVDNG